MHGLPRMPRKPCPLSENHPYHVGARTINREWFAIPMSEVWKITTYYLQFVQHAYGIEVLSFVLMSNHFHMLCRQPQLTLSEAMNFFMRETSRAINRETRRINQVWGGRHFKTLIESYHYYCCAYKYVYRNPVDAGICSRVEEYPYSTLNGLLGQQQLAVSMLEDITLFSDVEGTLAWLNTAPKEGHRDQLRRALRHPIMAFGKTPARKPHALETDPY